MVSRDVEFSSLMGKVIENILVDRTGNTITFWCKDGSNYVMEHIQDCCEDVYIEDVCGIVEDLLGSPITMADEATDNNESINPTIDNGDESFTWTFYKLATVKGYVTIRWYGTSNGYYSESVDFKEIIKEDKHDK